MLKTTLIFLLTTLIFAKNIHYELFQKGDPSTGHTLMVFGGIHGNEPGGYFAPAFLAQYYTIHKGALWVIPDLNQKSITFFRRGLNGDMNRKFADIDPKDDDFDTVEDIKSFINNKSVDLILNLHDGHGFYRQTYKDESFNPEAWGQTCVIDQICIDVNGTNFAQLSEIAHQVSKQLNTELMQEHHSFNVKNTKTRFKNFAMQQSLTYYAIKHNKPAFAIETSKNLVKTVDKVLYQLKAVEAFMKIMDINYTRSFSLDKESIEKKLKEYGTVTINDNITFNLEDVKGILRFIPMKDKHNSIKLSHPLADVIKQQTYYELFVGNRRVVSLFPQTFTMDDSLKQVDVSLNGLKQTIALPSTLDINGTFRIEAPKEYRVNIIGYTNKSYANENNLTLTYKDMIPLYAIDKDKHRFRAEVYHRDSFCGMIILNFLPQDKR